MSNSKSNTHVAEINIESLSNEELGAILHSSSRRERQSAAGRLAVLAKTEPESLLACKADLLDALGSREARTRWECFDALSYMIPFDVSICSDAFEAAEESLFDESNGTVRLAALRFLCKMGSMSNDNAVQIWPILDEALQCYHGDPEFTDMLVAVNDFASSKLPESVAQGLIDRMMFDANNEKSGLLRRSKSIIESAQASLSK